MKKETVFFAVFHSPGSFTTNTWEVPLVSDDLTVVAWPDRAYAFQIYKREDAVDGEQRYRGQRVQIGGWYYHPDSKVETLEQVKQNPSATDILIRNMGCNNWTHIVWSRWGNWPQDFDPACDTVLQRHKIGGAL